MDNYQENLVKDDPQIPSQSDSENVMPHILGKPFPFSVFMSPSHWDSSLEMAKQFYLRTSLLLQHPYMTAGWLLVYSVTIIPGASSFIYNSPEFVWRQRDQGEAFTTAEKLWRLKSWRQMEELLF